MLPPVTPTSYPLVVRTMLDFKAQLLVGDARMMREMARRWLDMENRLRGDVDSLLMQLQTMRNAGEALPVGKVVRLQRYQSLTAQIAVELANYGEYAGARIAREQENMLTLGMRHAIDAIKAYFTTYGKIAGAFDRLPVGALTAMIGLAGDGSPLRALIAKSWPTAVGGLTDALIDGILVGRNPNDTARIMFKKFGVGINRAINIARTESLRVYRTSNLEQYKASGVVNGYKRLSARDTRVCPACLFADDGTLLPLDYSFDAHPQCRCTLVPVVAGLPEVTWQNGVSWFLGQSPAEQGSILGAGRYQAWLDGKYELADVIKHVDNETWGGSLVPKSLAELINE